MNQINGIEAANDFRDTFDELFARADQKGQESFLLPIRDFDRFLTLLPSYPQEDDGLPPTVPEVNTADWHRHVNFRNAVRKRINNAAAVNSHDREPPYAIRVHYEPGRVIKKGAKAGQRKRQLDKLNYEVRLLSSTARVLHKEVGQALHTYATGKVKYLAKMNEFIREHLHQLPAEVQLAHKLRGKRTEKTISLAANLIMEDIKEAEDEYREVVAFIGVPNAPPVPLEHLPPKEEEDDD